LVTLIAARRRRRGMRQSDFISWVKGNLLTCSMVVCRRLGRAGVDILGQVVTENKTVLVMQCKECKRKWIYTITMEEGGLK
jgi:hypothetical protein